MRILVAPDSFKGSLSAPHVAEAIALGTLDAIPFADIIRLPLADGGEGTVDAIVSAKGGGILTAQVHGPLGGEMTATYGLIDEADTAVIEMAAAAGLHLVSPEHRNPLITTTYGVGELIKAALEKRVRKIIIGVGGSATNDGGAGAIQALGARFMDEKGRELPPGGASLARLADIDLSLFRFPRSKVNVVVACDVNNPLTGPQGASAVYGPQKGATHEMVKKLDQALSRYAEVITDKLDIDVASISGGGAAGGLAAGLVAFLGAALLPGVEIVLDAVNFDKHAASADLVITGEGRIDAQTLRGKTISGVIQRTKKYNVPVVAIAGSVGDGADVLRNEGLAGIYSITSVGVTEEVAMRNAGQLLRKTARDVAQSYRDLPEREMRQAQ